MYWKDIAYSMDNYKIFILKLCLCLSGLDSYQDKRENLKYVVFNYFFSNKLAICVFGNQLRSLN